MARGTDKPMCLPAPLALGPECQYVSKKMAKDYLFNQQNVDVTLESAEVAEISVVCLRLPPTARSL